MRQRSQQGDLEQIPGVGKPISENLRRIGIASAMRQMAELEGL